MSSEKPEGIVPALDSMPTIQAKPPEEIHLTYSLMVAAEILRKVVNSKWISLILYCSHCKSPLEYVYQENNIVFQCPECGTKWVKNETWESDRKGSYDKIPSLWDSINEGKK